jgi:hypothetical protein
MVSPAYLLAGLVLLLGTDNILLLRFLGLASPAIFAAATLSLAVLFGCLVRLTSRLQQGIPLSRLGICLGVAAVVMLLGGEGRIFYANTDWQIRDAVLNDMIRSTWPVVYPHDGGPMLLRAPIGMYLLPALVGKLGGLVSADWALLVQNSLVLGTILALGSLLFPSSRGRRIALLVLLAFSGMDTIGVILGRPSQLLPITRNIDGYGGIQYDANLTLAFWVPQHALIGWLGALLFLLWRAERISLGAFLSPLPLAALWSPLGLVGVMPFVAIAGAETLLRRKLRMSDIALPGLACLIVSGSLLYLAADAGSVGMQPFPVIPLVYMIVVLMDVVPFVVIPLASGATRVGRLTVLIAAVWLLAMPFLQLGGNTDTRASIPALAILAVLSIDVILNREAVLGRAAMMAVLAVGVMTPLREVARAIAFRPSPPPQCDLIDAWQPSYGNFPLTPYLARASALPPFLRGAALEATIGRPVRPPKQCWSRRWQQPRFG